MPDLHHILFPYDFSSQDRQAVPFVRALAKRWGARVTLFSVVPPTFEPVPPDMAPLLRTGDDAERWRQALQARLDPALADEFAGLSVDRVADGGDPALRIAHFAHDHAVDLIMMPTHGRGRFRRLLVGSVTSRVLDEARCPVWTAAHVETQTAPELPATILCAVDGSAATVGLVQYAVRFSATAGATLRLLHVVEPITDWPSLERERRLQEEVREQAGRALRSMLTSAGLDLPVRLEVGGIVSTVTGQAGREPADLVIIGRGSATKALGRLRSHAIGIIQGASCPVLSV